MVPKNLEDFLLGLVGEVRHSGRPFYAHLKGTFDILYEGHQPKHLCLAGLFHSIYGTRHFKHQALSFNQRGLVAHLIGNEAEHLAYVFCVTDRPRAFVEQVGQKYPCVRDRNTGGLIPLSKDDLLDLLAIEAANLAEQGGGPMLQSVLDSLKKMAGTA